MLLKIIKWILITLNGLGVLLLGELLKRLFFGAPTATAPLIQGLVLPPAIAKYELVLCIAILALLGTATFLAFHLDAIKQLRDKVAFYRSTNRLRPTDINPGRPWYTPFFLPRPEGQVVEFLTKGEGVILVGDPLLGKTRCAYEALRRLRGYHVVGLIPEQQDVGDLKIPRSYGLFQPRLIVFLDDLQRYLAKVSPVLLLQKLQDQVQTVAVLATCRSGEELLGVQKDPSFGPFLNQMLHELEPGRLSLSEAQDLAVRLGKKWDGMMYNGTPGTVVFGLESMRARLNTMTVDARRLMSSLFLMSEMGIETYRSVLTETVAKTVYGLESTQAEIDEAWLSLKRNGFFGYR